MNIEQIQHLTLIKVDGDDAKTFLQGQLTNDIQQLDQNWQFSAYCTPKGRALAVFTAWENKGNIYLLIESDIKEAVLKRLRMYVMRSKVVFEELPCSMFGLYDQESLTDVTQGLSINSPRYEQQTMGDKHLLSFGERCLLIDTNTDAFASKINEQESSLGAKTWTVHDIMECLPRVTAESSELFVPQMLNMDILNGINFKKGCYTGQEIVARMHYLGKLKQRNFVCKIPDDSTASIGEKVLDNNGKSVGNISNSAPGESVVTAALRFDNLDNGLVTENGADLTLTRHQPYKVPTEQ